MAYLISQSGSRGPLSAARNATLTIFVVLLFSFGSITHTSAKEFIKLAVDIWLPYENIGNKDVPGFSTEVVTNVLNEMGVKWDLREYPWARALKEVFEGRRDALFTAFWTEERARYVYYPKEPLAKERWLFFVRRKDTEHLSFVSYDEIKNRRIGVLRGASVSEEFWKFVKKYSNYEAAKTDDLNFKKLVKGRIDYVVTSYSNGIELARQMGISDQIAFLPSPIISEDDLYIIFSKKSVSPSFVDAFSDALRSFKKSDQFRAIYRKYFELP